MLVSRRQILSTLPAGAGLAAAGMLLLKPARAAASAGFSFTPPLGRFIYTVTRDNDPIGTQKLEFTAENDDGLLVVTDVEIDVRILGLSFYRFTQHIEERWQGGALQSLLSQTNDDGEERLVDLKREGDRLKGRYNDKTRDVPGSLIPSTLWHPDAIKQTEVLDTVRGRVHQVTVTDKGQVAVALPIGQQDARRYAFTGELNRDVWYGPDATILAAEMKAKDDSTIRQQLLDRAA
ncbi:DUF6134 family protein [Dongia sp.]|uniref:DUF6134 family protein n=1 Tax=Dongia sp. TaxID=1977262 RepID=UPI0035AF54FC